MKVCFTLRYKHDQVTLDAYSVLWQPVERQFKVNLNNADNAACLYLPVDQVQEVCVISTEEEGQC